MQDITHRYVTHDNYFISLYSLSAILLFHLKTIADKQSYLKLIVILCGHEIKGSVKQYEPNIIYTFADKAFKKKRFEM